MKPKSSFLRPALLASALLSASSSFTYAYTVEVDPAAAIPATHNLVFATEWNIDGNTEGWSPNGQFQLESGAPVGGILTGTESGNDPTLSLNGTSIPTSSDTIVEFKVKKQTADDSRIDLFWSDDNGGIGHVPPVRIDSPPFIPDDAFHVVRITFSGTDLAGPFSGFRLDPSADHTTPNFYTTSLDYFRVYSVPDPTVDLFWDPNMTGGPAGGTGIWNTTSNFWWNGTADVKWPAVSNMTDRAVFAGTAGVVTIQPAGITAASVKFDTVDYHLAGGPLTLDGTAIIRGSGRFYIEAPLAGSAAVVVPQGAPVFRTAATLTNSISFKTSRVVAAVDNAFGTAQVVLGAGGNIFISASDQNRSFSNNFKYAGNRLIIDNDALGEGIGAFGITIAGNLELAPTSPGDIFLRRSLTVNGIVTGTGANGRSIYLRGDVGTLTLNGVNSTFTGDITLSNSSRIVYQNDSSLGDFSNNLVFNGGQGKLEPLDSFTSDRAITINGDTAAVIDTDFDTIWSGPITGQLTNDVNAPVNSRLYKTGTGTLTLTGTTSLGGGTQTQEGILIIPSGGSLTHGSFWDNNHGVSGLAEMRIAGGDFTINSSFYAVGNGIQPLDEALFDIQSGTYTHNGGQLLLGFRGNGRFIMAGGDATLNELSYGDGGGVDPRTAIAELNGGNIAFNAATRRDGDANATIIFDGSTVRSLRNEPDFLRKGTAGTTDFLVGSDGGAIFDTDGKDVGIQQTLAHNPAAAATDSGLTKLGLGSLFLSGPHTYNGPTSVQGGTFGGNGSLTSNVTVASGAGLAVRVNKTGGVAGTDHSLLTVNGTVALPSSLKIRILPGADAFVENGATGMTVLTATGGITGFNAGSVTFDKTGFAGTGSFTASQSGNSIVLAYTAGAAGGYANFATTITNAAQRGKLDDADKDGISNLLEYALGGNPNSSDTGILPKQTLSPTNLTLTFNVSAASAADTNLVVQLSTDLVDWTTIPSIPVTGTGPQSIQIPRNSRNKLFARVVAVN